MNLSQLWFEGEPELCAAIGEESVIFLNEVRPVEVGKADLHMDFR